MFFYPWPWHFRTQAWSRGTKKDRRRLDERITGPKLHHRTNPVYSPVVVKKKDRLVFIYRYKHTVNTAERARTIL